VKEGALPIPQGAYDGNLTHTFPPTNHGCFVRIRPGARREKVAVQPQRMLRQWQTDEITQLTHLSIVSGGYLALGGNDGRICPWLRLPRFRRTISTMEVHQALEMLGGPAARSSRGCLDALPATQLPLSLPLSLLPVFFPSTGKAPLCLKAKRKSRVSVGSCAG